MCHSTNRLIDSSSAIGPVVSAAEEQQLKEEPPVQPHCTPLCMLYKKTGAGVLNDKCNVVGWLYIGFCV